jgi:hypothetical protein
VLYVSKTWYLKLREERRQRVFKNRVLRETFGPTWVYVKKNWRKLCNKELHNLYSSPNITWVFKTGRKRRAGRVTRMGRDDKHAGFR